MITFNPPPRQQRAEFPFEGVLKAFGMTIRVENHAGTFRFGQSADGKLWQNQMPAHYGEIRGTEGADGDAVDVFVRPDATGDEPMAYVVHQTEYGAGDAYDEDKVLLGFDSKDDALACYRAAYDRPSAVLGPVREVPVDRLKAWLSERGNRGRKIAVGKLAKAGPFVGPRGGLYADPDHKTPWGGDAAAHHKAAAAAHEPKTEHPDPVVATAHRGALYSHFQAHVAHSRSLPHAKSATLAAARASEEAARVEAERSEKGNLMKSIDDLLAATEPLVKSGGPFIGPKGGKWADAKHTIPWKDGGPKGNDGEKSHAEMAAKHKKAAEDNAGSKVVADAHLEAHRAHRAMAAEGDYADAQRKMIPPGAHAHWTERAEAIEDAHKNPNDAAMKDHAANADRHQGEWKKLRESGKGAQDPDVRHHKDREMYHRSLASAHESGIAGDHAAKQHYLETASGYSHGGAFMRPPKGPDSKLKKAEPPRFGGALGQLGAFIEGSRPEALAKSVPVEDAPAHTPAGSLALARRRAGGLLGWGANG